MATLPSHHQSGRPVSPSTSSGPEDVVAEKTTDVLEKNPSASAGSSNSSSRSPTASEPPSSSHETTTTISIDPVAERRLLRKTDLHVYPILFVIYMLSFLDRINISNARIQGLTEDLDMHDNDFNIALFVSHSESPAAAPTNMYKASS